MSDVPLAEDDSTPFYQWIKEKHEDELDRLAIAGAELTQQVMILSADVSRIADQVNVTTTALNEVLARARSAPSAAAARLVTMLREREFAARVRGWHDRGGGTRHGGR